MFKTRKILLLGIIMVLILGTIIPVFAADYTYTLTVNPTTISAKKGDTISVEIGIADIDQTTDGISALQGDVIYDEDFFESVNFVGVGNNWSTTYNKNSENENEGRFVAAQLGSVKESQVITKLVATVKADTTKETGIITLKEVYSSYVRSETDRKTKTITVNITSSTPEDPDEKKDEQGEEKQDNTIIDNNTNKSTTPDSSSKSSSSTQNSSTNSKSALPKAGIESWIGIFIVALVIVGIIELIKYKRSMK